MEPRARSVFQKIDHSRTADDIVAHVEGLILDGILRDGDRLPGERELAATLDVSRPILRDALKALEARGLVVARHGGGTYVADIVGQVFSDPVAALIARHPRATRDYLDYRREMEGLTAALAAERATEADRRLLTSVLADMRAAHESGRFDDELAADIELHNVIGEAAHNIVLMHTMRACYRLLADGIFFSRREVFAAPGARAALLDQHVAIVEAILAGDAAGARQAAEAHIDYVIDATLRAERSGGRSRIADLRLLQRERRAPTRSKPAGPSA